MVKKSVEVNPMTEKEYIEWYKSHYNIEPPSRFLRSCIDNYNNQEQSSCDDDWLNDFLEEDDTEDWLK